MHNDRYRLSGTYERLRRRLLELPDDGRLDRPLSYWVLPTDRRLPIAFLSLPLRELLSKPIEELLATPGIGQKKILGLFDLLRRTTKASEVEKPFGFSPPNQAPRQDAFDPASVSEAVWTTWCETVSRFEFGHEPLGRLAPSLQGLPTVIWHAPMSRYAELSLAEIRQLKTHGKKRVGAILEVFRTLHEAVSTAVLPETLDLRLVPRQIGAASAWLTQAIRSSDMVDADEIGEGLFEPLARQIDIDLGPAVAALARNRLSLEGPPQTVKQQADRLKVTRARVYQLLDDCATAMDVRWPEGRWLIAALACRFDPTNHEAHAAVRNLQELLFPLERESRLPKPGSPVDLTLGHPI